MTKEEIAVIQAAYKDHRGCAPETCGGSSLDPCALGNALESLTYSCHECNTGGHTCPGDGESIPHGATDCGQHEDSFTTPRKRLAHYLSEYAHNVVEEWMRIVEIDQDVEEPGSTAFQACATWMGDGTFILGREPHSADYGQYRLIVRVQALPDPPPIGPEGDGALRAELAATADTIVQSVIEPVEPDPEWIMTEWRFVLNADRIRLDGQEADVLTSSANEFYANNTDPYRPTPWQHTEVLVELAHLPGRKLPFPPSGPVEILMDRSRKAVYVLQQAFPETREVRP